MSLKATANYVGKQCGVLAGRVEHKLMGQIPGTMSMNIT